MKDFFKRLTAFAARRRQCPDCPDAKNIHGRYGCLGSDLINPPYLPCKCKRTFDKTPGGHRG